MKKHYAIEMKDGSVAIMETPAYAAKTGDHIGLIKWSDGAPTICMDGEWMPLAAGAELVYATPEECIAKWPQEKRAQVLRVRAIDLAQVPTDRTYRDAWTPNLTVDMEKARSIQRDRVRAARAPLLQALDVEYMKALEMGDTAAMEFIAGEKQALRDAPADPRINAASTPEELKAILPTRAFAEKA